MALTELSVLCEFCGIGVADAIFLHFGVYVNQEGIVYHFSLWGLFIFTRDFR